MLKKRNKLKIKPQAPHPEIMFWILFQWKNWKIVIQTRNEQEQMVQTSEFGPKLPYLTVFPVLRIAKLTNKHTLIISFTF